MFDIIQRNREGFVSQRALKEHMARHGSPLSKTIYMPNEELRPQPTLSELTVDSGGSFAQPQQQESNQCLAAKQTPAGVTRSCCSASTAASPPSVSSQIGSPGNDWRVITSKVDGPPPKVLENMGHRKEMTAPRKQRNGAKIELDGARNRRSRPNPQALLELEQVLENPVDALGEAAIAACFGTSSQSSLASGGRRTTGSSAKTQIWSSRRTVPNSHPQGQSPAIRFRSTPDVEPPSTVQSL